ncbi:MAG: hypothetical protein GC162_15920 [Planctomycetes bacterium]|nr:hypothetical protein [Planctomycetota bacterium]
METPSHHRPSQVLAACLSSSCGVLLVVSLMILLQGISKEAYEPLESVDFVLLVIASPIVMALWLLWLVTLLFGVCRRRLPRTAAVALVIPAMAIYLMHGLPAEYFRHDLEFLLFEDQFVSAPPQPTHVSEILVPPIKAAPLVPPHGSDASPNGE